MGFIKLWVSRISNYSFIMPDNMIHISEVSQLFHMMTSTLNSISTFHKLSHNFENFSESNIIDIFYLRKCLDLNSFRWKSKKTMYNSCYFFDQIPKPNFPLAFPMSSISYFSCSILAKISFPALFMKLILIRIL